ncbi:hypothetical protein AUK10_01170 [Candidatus Gracilibacteria bacterium CG2_30_37_12]|nr:MAG: hypothetical protein AUK10_01170 [Candidatus Gracilibacteria bacterium CG2_30_37_12]
MRNLFQDYKKQNSKKNTVIIVASLAFAFSINAFLFSTDMGARLQTSVLNSTTNTNATPADINIISAGTGTDMLKIQTNSRLENVSRVILPLAFDPEGLTMSNVFSEDKDIEVVQNANIPGNSTITLLLKKPKTLTEKTPLVTIVYKKTVQKTVLNLGETQFRSSDGTLYNLTNTSLEF